MHTPHTHTCTQIHTHIYIYIYIFLVTSRSSIWCRACWYHLSYRIMVSLSVIYDWCFTYSLSRHIVGRWDDVSWIHAGNKDNTSYSTTIAVCCTISKSIWYILYVVVVEYCNSYLIALFMAGSHKYTHSPQGFTMLIYYVWNSWWIWIYISIIIERFPRVECRVFIWLHQLDIV